MPSSRTIDDFVETLKKAKERGKTCTLLIGAGCSFKAGIPLAGKFVDIIKNEYPRAYNRAPEKTYPACMNELLHGERRDLIAKYVDNAKINWAHIGIAQLMKEGYVDRVLTTNFDPLIVRACALVNLFPAVYDFASCQLFNPADIPEQSVFYLHGQRTGFVLLNTKEECESHFAHLASVFEDAGRGRLWLVVGYSGENDPVFNHLSEVNRFDNGLFWVGIEDFPKAHVSEKVLAKGKNAFYIKTTDADDFFVTLTQKLDCFPPDYIHKPLVYLDEILSKISPYSLPGQDTDIDVNELARTIINNASDVSTTMTAQYYLMAGDYDKVINIEHVEGENEQIDNLVSLSYFMKGTNFCELALNNSGDEADSLYKEACRNYELSVLRNPANDKAFYNWATTLSKLAETKSGEEADRLYLEACEKYELAVKIKPDKHKAFNNWGTTLLNLAKTKSGEEADRLYLEACEKYELAVKIKPDNHEAFNDWGHALSDLAETKSGEEADRLYFEACEKYELAVKIKPDNQEAFYNWGTTLLYLVKTKSGEEAEHLYLEAYEKYELAVKIKPDKHEAFNNWGYVLLNLAKTKSGEEADRLYFQACRKYEIALKIKPDNHEAFNNWGSTLVKWAKTKSGEEADRLYFQACKKYELAVKIKPDNHEAFYNWGDALSDLAETKSGEEADRLYFQACKKYELAVKIKPDNHEAFYNWGHALSDLAETKSGEEGDRLYLEACEKYELAVKIKPDKQEAFYNWGYVLLNLAKTKSGEEADRLYFQACKNYEAVVKIKPDNQEAFNNWGMALLEIAKTKVEQTAKELYMLSKEKFMKAEDLMPGQAAYNLACWSALNEFQEECLHWLQVAENTNSLPSLEHIRQDQDLSSVRETSWFKDFLEKIAS